MDHVIPFWFNDWRTNNGTERRSAEPEDPKLAKIQVSDPLTTLGDVPIPAVVSKTSQLVFVIIAGARAADNVAKGRRSVENIAQVKRAVSLGAGALREQFDWDLDVANRDGFEALACERVHNSLKRRVGGKPGTVPRDAEKKGRVSLNVSRQVDC